MRGILEMNKFVNNEEYQSVWQHSQTSPMSELDRELILSNEGLYSPNFVQMRFTCY
jgi:hypothetical protein